VPHEDQAVSDLRGIAPLPRERGNRLRLRNLDAAPVGCESPMMVRAFHAIAYNLALREIGSEVLAASIQNADSARASAKSYKAPAKISASNRTASQLRLLAKEAPTRGRLRQIGHGHAQRRLRLSLRPSPYICDLYAAHICLSPTKKMWHRHSCRCLRSQEGHRHRQEYVHPTRRRAWQGTRCLCHMILGPDAPSPSAVLTNVISESPFASFTTKTDSAFLSRFVACEAQKYCPTLQIAMQTDRIPASAPFAQPGATPTQGKLHI